MKSTYFHLSFFIGIGCFLIMFLFYILVISIPKNPINSRYSFFNSNKMHALLPEGWAFFTRNPREEQISVYNVNKDKSIEPISIKNMEIKNLFGLDRTSRYTLDKMGTVIGQLPDGYWKTITNLDSLNFYIDSLSVFSVEISRPSLCGKYLIEKRPIMPWSYYSSTKNVVLPSKYVTIKFDCKND